MSQTYFGSNISKDHEMVARYTRLIPVSKLHVGLSASMNASGAAHCKQGDNGWTAKLMCFSAGAGSIIIQDFVFDELAAWLQSPITAPLL